MKIPKFSRKTTRAITLLVAFSAIVTLILLASGIPQVTFNPEQPLNLQFKDSRKFPSGEQWSMPLLGSLLLTLALASIPLAIILLIFSSEARKLFKKYMGPMLFLVAVYGIYLYIAKNETETVEPLENLEHPSAGTEILTFDQEADELDVYSHPELPSWLGYAIGAITILGFGIGGYLLWIKNHPEQSDLSDITLRAIRDIQGGRHWEDVVIQCYARMSKAVSVQRKIGREISTTPAEYAVQLEGAGLPPEPIANLTLLFEKARYSDRKSKTGEATEATQYLTEILDYLERSV